ncbi:MAG: hypothetical protein JXA09_04000 [Anaerolineae bacterium]|nr:hypothetical protein [Anaerolineae bacterium]
MDRERLASGIAQWLTQIDVFSRLVTRVPLRPYQLEPARAILRSVIDGQGLQFAVMMCRQAGKNELSAQIEAYLLNLYQRRGGGLVKASPTFKPQTINSILRLCDRLQNPWSQGQYRRREGYIVQLGKARAFFFSAEPHASVVGGTASVLLECDEAQDVQEAKWDKDFEPMTASTNATRVFYGTAWTSDTLLAVTIAHLRERERADGCRRVYTYDAEQVGAVLPAYAAHVKARVAKLGRNHPLIRTQYYLETIDSAGGLFDRQRRALMRGDHARHTEPIPGHRYCLLVDVGGEDEAEGDVLSRVLLENPRRDATALTVVDVDLASGGLPRYRVADRQAWIGVRHTSLQQRILALTRHWHAVWVLVDATGIGAGLASFLAKALGERVVPIVFSSKLKSDLGWSFVGVVETGRYRDYADDDAPVTRQFWYEVERCQYRVRPGPAHSISWGVWDTPAYDGVIAHGHDDLIVSAAMCALLDDYAWPVTGKSATVDRLDEIAEIDRGGW